MTLRNIQPRQCSARPPEGTLPCIIFTFYLPFVSYIKHTDLSFRSKPYSVPCHLSGSSEPLILDSYSVYDPALFCLSLPLFNPLDCCYLWLSGLLTLPAFLSMSIELCFDCVCSVFAVVFLSKALWMWMSRPLRVLNWKDFCTHHSPRNAGLLIS